MEEIIYTAQKRRGGTGKNSLGTEAQRAQGHMGEFSDASFADENCSPENGRRREEAVLE